MKAAASVASAPLSPTLTHTRTGAAHLASRPGDLIVDPCCGAGTTLVAAVRTGRRAIGGDVLREHAEIAARRIQKPQQQPLFLAGGANG